MTGEEGIKVVCRIRSPGKIHVLASDGTDIANASEPEIAVRRQKALPIEALQSPGSGSLFGIESTHTP